MPELPEVETIRRDLEVEVVGRRIDAVRITGARTVRRVDPADLVATVTGASVTAVRRRGKYLVVSLDTGRLLVVHLRMSGQLLLARAGDAEPKHTHAVLALGAGDEVRFVDPRTFGELFVADPDHLGVIAPQLAALGIDPLDDVASWRRFGPTVRAKRMRLKDLLTDQRVVAGLGNIYSDEILHRARLRFDRPGDSLSAAELRRLARAVPEVVAEAVAARGSSLADAQYVDLYGRPGRFAASHRVYARAGQACGSCRRRATIERVRWQGRSTFYCPACQV